VREQRVADFMLEFDCCREEARWQIERMDKTESDPRWDYAGQRPEPWYEDDMYRLRRNRREEARADAGPERELTAADLLQRDKVHGVFMAGQRREYELRRDEEEEGLW